MGWSFYIAFTRTLGLMFYDIKFKGERILYELSMQEATAQYGGNQPKVGLDRPRLLNRANAIDARLPTPSTMTLTIGLCYPCLVYSKNTN